MRESCVMPGRDFLALPAYGQEIGRATGLPLFVQAVEFARPWFRA